jgi:CO dehydrogenase/acetyl-CoA synthase alpha subunit
MSPWYRDKCSCLICIRPGAQPRVTEVKQSDVEGESSFHPFYPPTCSLCTYCVPGTILEMDSSTAKKVLPSCTFTGVDRH